MLLFCFAVCFGRCRSVSVDVAAAAWCYSGAILAAIDALAADIAFFCPKVNMLLRTSGAERTTCCALRVLNHCVVLLDLLLVRWLQKDDDRVELGKVQLFHLVWRDVQQAVLSLKTKCTVHIVLIATQAPARHARVRIRQPNWPLRI